MHESVAFQRGQVSPTSCLGEAWQRIRGQYWLFFGITVVGLLLGGIAPLGILLGPMMCGIALCFLDHWRGVPVQFARLFQGFDHFAESLIATLTMMAASLIVTLPLVALFFVPPMILMFAGASSKAAPALGGLAVLAFALAFVAMMAVSTLLWSLFSFTFALIVDKKCRGLEAVQLSARAALANWQGMFGLAILSMLLSLAGMCCCYVGALLVAPVTMGAQFVAYERVFGNPGGAA